MINDPIWQRDLVAALHLENLFIAQGLGGSGAASASDLQPSWSDMVRAIANIRTWRTYLPAPCVAKMIEDGWQWST
jgi:hypothetical protein